MNGWTKKRRRNSLNEPESTVQYHYLWMALLVALLLLEPAESFTLRMDTYKPPVKSSVSKFYQRRLNRNGTSGGSASSNTSTGRTHGRSTADRDSSKAASASAASFAPGPASFEQRMRHALFGGVNTRKSSLPSANRPPFQQKASSLEPPKARPEDSSLAAASSPTVSTTRPRQKTRATGNPHVLSIETLSDFQTVVGEEKDRLVVVRFHATYCRACKAVTPLYHHLARQHSDLVQFVDVPVTQANAVLHRGMGVPSLPYVHLYHPTNGLVEEGKLTRKELKEFADTLQGHVHNWEQEQQNEDALSP